MTSPTCSQIAERLNAGCQCVSLDRERLRAELEHESPGFFETVMEGRPHRCHRAGGRAAGVSRPYLRLGA
jgi:hypothetical protein